MKGVERQLAQLMDEGFTKQDACLALGLDVEHADVMLKVTSKTPVTIEELVESSKPEMVQIIIDIARGRVPDTRPSDRLKAAQILVEGKGVLPENTSNAFAERLARMKQAKESLLITNGHQELIEV